MNNLHFSEQKFDAILHSIIFRIEHLKMEMQEYGKSKELEQELNRANEIYDYFSKCPNGFTLEQMETIYVYLYLYNNFCQHNYEFVDDLDSTQELLNEFEQQFKNSGVNISDFFTLHDSIESYNNAIHKTHIGRNDPCPCGSGKKYKHCCGN